MKKRAWKDIEEAIRARGPEKQMAGKEEFWEDFKARARLRVQDRAVEERKPVIYRWPMATAFATLLIAVVGLYVVFSPATDLPSRIRSYEVVAGHSAVLIMNDQPAKATILWVADMKIDGAKRR